jgi:hypothetical protein
MCFDKLPSPFNINVAVVRRKEEGRKGGRSKD